MRYEGVTFIESSISRMDKEAFVEQHMSLFWKNRDEKIRRKMLGEVYDLITKPSKKSK